MTRNQRLWTPAFAALCLSVALGYTHHAFLLPTIPLYVDAQGGSAFTAGLALLAYSVPSFLVRPFFGRYADTWGGAAVLTIGLLLMTVGGLVYLSGMLGLIFVAAVIRGSGLGAVSAGGFTMLAHAAPPARRGEAAGYFSGATNSAVVFFPAAALWLLDRPELSYPAVFLSSIAIAATGVVISHLVLARLSPAPVQPLMPHAAERGAVRADWSVLPATALNVGSNLVVPAVTAFLPLYALRLGLGDVAVFYILAGLGSLLIRPILGILSDSIGRGRIILAGYLLQLIGLLSILIGGDLLLTIAGGVIVSIGNAVNGAATTALAMDVAPPDRRGAAMSTFSTSLQIGQGLGGVLAGWLADMIGLRFMYGGMMIPIGLGLLVLAYTWRTISRRPEQDT